MTSKQYSIEISEIEPSYRVHIFSNYLIVQANVNVTITFKEENTTHPRKMWSSSKYHSLKFLR